MNFSEIIAYGHYLPETFLKNEDLKKFVDTSDEWIFSRTGIRQRHIAEKKELTSHLAIKASEDAFNSFKIDPKEIDCIIIATTTPDNTFPSTASKVQNHFKISNIPSFDIQAVCSGFIYGIQIADSFIKSGKYNKILLIGAETLSKIIDWKDRRTCVLFGDGAGSLVISSSKKKNGVLASKIYSDGEWIDSLYADGGPSLNQKVGKIRMVGQDIFKHAVKKLSESTEQALSQCDLSVKDISWFIPHQANQRIILSTAKKLGISEAKTISTVKFHANTSAASIPLAMASAYKSGKLKKNDILALCAIGGGLTWGSCIIRV